MKQLLPFFTVALFLLLNPFSGIAQVSYQNNVQSTAVLNSDMPNSSGTISNFTVPAGSNRLLVVFIGKGAASGGPPTVTSITFDGETWTVANNQAEIADADDVGSEIWYKVMNGTNSVTSDLVVTFSKAVGSAQIGVASFADVDVAMPIGNTNTATSPRSTATNAGSLIVSTTAGNMVVDCVRQSATDGFTFGANQTELFDLASFNTGQQTTGSSFETATGSSTTMSWTSNQFMGTPGDQYGYCAVELRAFINVPVELVYFKAKPTKSGNQLLWQTASELNNKGFEIERLPAEQAGSSTGKIWKTIGFVAGHGTTIETQDYSFLDEMPLSGINYYRLEQIDTDGTFEYSSIVQVSTKGEIVYVFPNPVGEVLNYQVADLETVQRVQLFDVTGQLLQESTDINGQLSLNALPNGIYLFVLETTTDRLQQRIIKK